MQLGMIGLGRMGANMVQRLLAGGHQCVVHDANLAAARPLVGEGATAAPTLDAFVAALTPPRAVWLMVPAGVVDDVVADLAPRLAPGDLLVDGGNSHYVDDIRRARALGERGLDYLDVGTSGGVWGRERGYCLMVGGPEAAVRRLLPVLRTLAPGRGDLPRTPGRDGRASTADEGFLHCGPAGAGHFVKMVHNGIEYGLMAAYAEGFNVLRLADVGKAVGAADAETAPLRHPEHFQYAFDLADIAEVWRRGSVVASWLLDLTAQALARDPSLDHYAGRVADSGEGRWTVEAAIQQGAPAPVLSAALYQRFASRERDLFARKVLSAMRHAFGGHAEPPGATGSGS